MRTEEFRPKLPQRGDLFLKVPAGAAAGGVPGDAEFAGRLGGRRGGNVQVAGGEVDVAVVGAFDRGDLRREPRERDPDVFTGLGVAHLGLGDPEVVERPETEVAEAADLGFDAARRSLDADGQPGDAFADRHGQEASGVPGLVGGELGDVSEADLAHALGGERIDAGAVDVAGDVLNDAGVDAAPDFGFERDARLFLLDDDAVHHLAVDVERVAGDGRAVGQRELELSLELADVRVEERHRGRGLDLEADDAGAHVHLAKLHRLARLLRSLRNDHARRHGRTRRPRGGEWPLGALLCVGGQGHEGQRGDHRRRSHVVGSFL